MSSNQSSRQDTGLEIAVIGMAGRFPGARNLNEFWDNLINGVESVSFFSREELAESSIDFELLDNPGYVKAKGILEDIEYFDASFFGHSPKEAEIMSPQTRMAYECAWEALEDAGYEPNAYDGAIGVFIGASHSVYWEALSVISGKSENFGEFESTMLNNKDFLSTRVSYKLDLKGPSFTLFTGCSTSGVAIHQACQSILSGESHMTLAGGVSIWLPKKSGYLYQEGSIFSKNGHCRTFDAAADGTVFGDGIGLVVLKALEDARGDRDHIYAVIKGTGINNDGNRKVGYAAPSTEGEAAAIRAAHHMADVEPESISYIEAHGTGTPVGDPIEIEALKLAFNTNKKGFCKIGSVKSNIGHLNTAAGVSGFIKAVLALKHRLIPPTINYSKPNTKIDFNNSPFRVNTQLTRWENDTYPLRAGVNSFGVGGTNVHIVLEEAPENKPKKTHSRLCQLILLSAKTENSLEQMTVNLAEYFKNNPDINLADAAYTLQVGRKEFKHRKMMVCSRRDEAAALLSSPGPGVCTYSSPEENKSLIFMFPGQGSQYVNMGLQLYRTERVFREEMEHCFEILKLLMAYDLKEILYPGERKASSAKRHAIDQTEITQPVLFIFEYALAKLLMNWGIRPDALIGHSIGEYVATCLSGVFSLEDALTLVVLRGKLMQKMPLGSMLSVTISEEELTPLSNEKIALAAVNAPSLCVVSGPHQALRRFKNMVEEKGIKTRQLQTSHAFHSPMMDPILKEFQQETVKIQVNQPKIPYISNLSGTWITNKDISNPLYWANHLRRTVRFSDGVKELLKKKNPVFVEVGPGNALGTLVSKIPGDNAKEVRQIVNLVRHPQQDVSDTAFLLERIGRLWLYGLKIDWMGFYSREIRRRIPLPTYPFEGKPYWIEGNPFNIAVWPKLASSPISKKPNILDWFYIPIWKQSPSAALRNKKTSKACGWLVFIDDNIAFHSQVVMQLQKEAHDLIAVKPAAEFSKKSNTVYTINPVNSDDYDSLLKEIRARDMTPQNIIHLWGINAISRNQYDSPGTESFNNALDMGFFSIIYLAQALGKVNFSHHIRLTVVTDGMHLVTGEEVLSPVKTTVLAPVITINQEYSGISCRSLDIILPEPGQPKEKKLVHQLLDEFKGESTDLVVAYRNHQRWERTFEPVKPKELQGKTPHLRKNGVYLIIGGLGEIGFILAKELVKQVGAKLVLTGRTPLPPKKEWEHRLSNGEKKDPVSRKLEKVRELERLGARVMVFNANIADRAQMETVIQHSEQCLGPINGVIHAAGIVGQRSFHIINELDRQECQRQFEAKVNGISILETIFQGKKLDFCLLISSLASILGGMGLTAYSAANLYMDAFAARNNRSTLQEWLSVNWDMWQLEGDEEYRQNQLLNSHLGELSITPEEGVKAFYCLLSQLTGAQLVVSTADLPARVNRWAKISPPKGKSSPREAFESSSARQTLLTSYAAPGNQLERMIVDVLQEYFGIEPISIHDNLFDLGATSIDLVQINSKLNTLLGRKIPLVKMLTYTTVNSFVGYLIEEVIGNTSYNREINREAEIKRGKKSMQQRFNKKMQM